MPWPSYAALSADVTAALVAYLRSLSPVDAPRVEPVPEAAAATAPFYRVVVPGN
ncbi:MAG TPA: hypothetical protein PKA33_06255 [Amaricoccus sp.]|nr:hypothetical protein [Amaricoccus sp.]